MLLELLGALSRGFDDQLLRLVSWPQDVYQINPRVHPTPLCQCEQHMRRSIANEVTLALRLSPPTL
jgi:hypothetical protein